MIAHLQGILELVDKNYLVVEVAGLGYHVKVATSTLARLPRVGETIKLFTHQLVREDDISLYGFLTKEEKNFFGLLLKVSGVGPKAALAFLSALPIEKLAAAIASGDVDLISTVPGIGKKTAQKLVIELKEKVAKAFAVKPSDLILGLAEEEKSLVSDAISALISLGYSPHEAREVILKVDLENAASVELIIKQALKELV
ncbi:Holliday junction branch migration protein RuvA [Candidatus Saganbacteria bacterium CG08_land_8_20_14_0_20_45_16]|uniref:Holliday junction branch migration complex subunit RuvA n=1 Tax=Candidatus Saganbacteria bacterium CG08_land_8_20_14_0_20_45_16 TaxID=2014293 RepID=A0A2H0XVJ8_UNCSA|nr:MAG: Holliday junction branch migration protein RuvA [Candidatus Saganbacteria bacterium CG08_land_8_20_14_0_20_45_16]